MKTIGLVALLVVSSIGCSTLFFPQAVCAAADQAPILYLFWGDGCPHCEEEKEFLLEIYQQYPNIEMRWFEVWGHPKYALLADTLRKAAGIATTSVPMTFIHDWSLVGFRSAETSGIEIIEQLEECLNTGCKDVLTTIGPQRIAEEIRRDIAKGECEDWEYFPPREAK
ncbi:hypothetical protein CSB45_03500 [candidate division KSB3 bacterium]|uniref:Thioredoxin domain-containing protein n=1 Tax=candidate division KSB3 bacterium TaxID=2044937 RepID=A0A2G6EA20_9BACT|nr:MAG: hypothetical protein CSB45_03500 [candidate division KSB3 bacterium]PIE29559.1 MAG: hypothetical protein CSA57_08095 [candidate division KSB3 bacterium]